MSEPRTVIVTDSTASLSPSVAQEHGIVVVPLQVVLGATTYDEGEGGATPDMVADALREWIPVSTSRPNPAVMLEAYEKAAAAGATEVLSIHLSGEMSGTHESAVVAARQAPVPVTTLDTRQVGVATGYAVMAAAAVLAAGGSTEAAVQAARRRAESCTSLFYVDTLEYLRRGGRIGTASALLGGALAVKPLLRISDGTVEPFEKVRTAGRALHRLEDLAVEAAGEAPVEVTVAHLASPERAQALAGRLAARLDVVGEVECAELGAVLGAHVGPGMVAVCVAPAID